MLGHVKIGPVGDIRDYLLNNPAGLQRTNANQMADKLGTGAGDYSDLTSWTAFSMDDWQAGVGKKDPAAGGFIYADTETRFPNKFTLPNALVAATQADATNYFLNTGNAPGVLKAEASLSIGAGSAIKQISKAIKGNGTNLIGIHVCLKNDDDVESVRFNLCSTTGSPAKPLSIISTADEFLDNTIGLGNHYVVFNNATVDGTTYHVTIEPTNPADTMSLPIDQSSEDTAADLVNTSNGSGWSLYAGGRPLMEPVLGMPATSVTKLIYFPATGYMYAAAGAILYKQESDADKWVAVHAAFSANISDLHTDGDTLYIGLGDGANNYTMDGSEAFTAGTTPARIFTRWKGFLWWAVGNSVYYTNNVDPAVGPIEVTPAGFAVNGLSGQGDYMFVACDDALYYVGYADLVYTITPWGQINPAEDFGAGMLNWQDALYIPIAQGIIRYDASAMLPVGPDLGEGLPLFRSGSIGALATQNNWLYCTVIATGGASSVWAYNGQGWHSIATAPSADLLYFTSIYYRRDKQRIYLGTNTGAIFYVVAVDSPNALAVNTATYTATTASLETDWVYGGLKRVQKDVESIVVLGDDIDTNHTVQVYWQDDESAGQWEYLGEITADGQELRWSDYTTRPNTKQIKLGLILNAKDSNSPVGTPVVRSVVLKYHNMVMDTWRWGMTIRVTEGQIGGDGVANAYTVAQMITHLDAVVNQVPPLIFQDLVVSTPQYEAKVVSASRRIEKVDNVDGAYVPTYLYDIQLEQVTNSEYVP